MARCEQRRIQDAGVTGLCPQTVLVVPRHSNDFRSARFLFVGDQKRAVVMCFAISLEVTEQVAERRQSVGRKSMLDERVVPMDANKEDPRLGIKDRIDPAPKHPGP